MLALLTDALIATCRTVSRGSPGNAAQRVGLSGLAGLLPAASAGGCT